MRGRERISYRASYSEPPRADIRKPVQSFPYLGQELVGLNINFNVRSNGFGILRYFESNVVSCLSVETSKEEPSSLLLRRVDKISFLGAFSNVPREVSSVRQSARVNIA